MSAAQPRPSSDPSPTAFRSLSQRVRSLGERWPPVAPANQRPPGPSVLELPATIRAFAVDSLGTVERFTRIYGDVVCVPIPFEPVYTFHHPEHIEDLLVRKRKAFIKSRTMRELGTLVGNGLLVSEGNEWRRNRKLIAPPLARNRIARYAEEMVALTEAHVGEWRDGARIDVHAEMTRLTLEITVRTLFDTPLTGDVSEIAHALEDAMAAYQVLWQTWQRFVPRSWPTPVMRKLDAAAKRLDDALLRVIRERRAQGADPDATDLLSLLMRARDEEGGQLDERQLRDEALTIFVAGHETTALGLSYTLHLLGQRPDLMARVVDEVDEVIGERRPTLDDVPALRVLDAVVREGLRLYPPAWGIGREAIEPVEIGGWELPVGAQVMTTTWAVHRDPRWWPNPLQAIPERWLEPSPDRPKYAWFPFGGGPRVCIGNHFALMETVLVLATLLRRWRLDETSPRALSFFPSVTLRPACKIEATVRHR